jgi:hypothetical protein
MPYLCWRQIIKAFDERARRVLIYQIVATIGRGKREAKARARDAWAVLVGIAKWRTKAIQARTVALMFFGRVHESLFLMLVRS